MDKPLILIVDDEEDIRELLRLGLEPRGFDVDEAGTLAEAYAALDRRSYDLCLTDMLLPDGNGIELVGHIANGPLPMPVAMITAHGSVESAVEALKAGAFDFIAKPIDMKVLQVVVENAVRRREPVAGESTLLGESPAMQVLRDAVSEVAANRAPVTLTGEPGTGKALAAREIHRLSAAPDRPFVAVNCAALPEEHLLDAFFGGPAALSVANDERGFLRAAQGGTLYLNHVPALSPFIQAKLLDVIQQRTLPSGRGGNREIFDVRLLSSSSGGLGEALAEGSLRHDLYYRLNVIEVRVPPLRERVQDLPQLCSMILGEISEHWGRPVPDLSDGALSKLRDYRFPGNVRELQNILERAVALSGGDRIEATDIDFPAASKVAGAAGHADETLPARLEADERAAIIEALEKARWNRTAAARALGMSFRQLRYRIKKFGIDDGIDD